MFRRLVAANATLTVLLFVAACGGADPDARKASPPMPSATPFASLPVQEMVRSSMAAMRDLGSFRMLLRGKEGDESLTADFRVDDEKRCAGLITMDTDVQVQVIVTSGATYQKGDERYWSQGAEDEDKELIAAASGRWVKSPPIPQFAALCDLDKMLDEAESDLGDSDAGDLTAGKVTEFDGQSVVELTSSSHDDSGAILIETEPPHRMLSIAGGEHAEYVFSEFDEPVEIDVPEPGEYVDFAQLAP